LLLLLLCLLFLFLLSFLFLFPFVFHQTFNSFCRRLRGDDQRPDRRTACFEPWGGEEAEVEFLVVLVVLFYIMLDVCILIIVFPSRNYEFLL
jgi:hypothetical protein